MHHKIDTPAAVRYSALFPAFEADAMVAMIEHEPIGEDGIADLILLNLKVVDFVGHKYGPDSEELRATLGEMDRHLARILGALEKKVGNDYLLAVTADHGMPSEPSSADRRHFAPSIVDLLNNEFDPEGKQLVTSFEPENLQIFIDEDRLAKLGLTLADLASVPQKTAVLVRRIYERRGAACCGGALAGSRPSAMPQPGLDGLESGQNPHPGRST